MELDPRVTLILINFGVCIPMFWMSLCRVAKMDSFTKEAIRYRYVMWFLVSIVSAFSWIIDQPATVGQIAFGVCVTLDLLMGFRPWMYGAPHWSKKPEEVRL